VSGVYYLRVKTSTATGTARIVK